MVFLKTKFGSHGLSPANSCSLSTSKEVLPKRKRAEVAGSPPTLFQKGPHGSDGGSQQIITEGKSRVRFLHQHFLLLLRKNRILNLTFDVLQSKKGPSEKSFRLRCEIRGFRPKSLRVSLLAPSSSFPLLVTSPAALFTFGMF